MPSSFQSKNRPENPLVGQRILVTRAADTACRMAKLIRTAGGEAISHPVIKLCPVSELKALDQTITNLGSYAWLVFVSPSGVRFFLERIKRLLGQDFDFSGHQIAVIGKSTAEHLASVAEVEVDLIPANANSEALGKAIVEANLKGKILMVRANRGSSELAERLTFAQLDFEEIAVYRSVDVVKADPNVDRLLRAGEVDWVTVTSSAIANSTIALFGDALHQVKLASISPATSQEIEKLGFRVSCEAKSYDFDGMIDAIVKHTRS